MFKENSIISFYEHYRKDVENKTQIQSDFKRRFSQYFQAVRNIYLYQLQKVEVEEVEKLKITGEKKKNTQ